MLIKTPKFWFKNKNKINPIYFTLKPLSNLWEIFIKFRLKNGLWEKMPIPIICVGNITLGGSGKTPVTMAIQNLLREMGIKACVVSRGYGGKNKYPNYVRKNDTFHKVGDEPIILSAKGAVIVSKNKKQGIIKAYNDGFDIVILDDGFQNSTIKKDLSLVVIDSKILFGNGYIFPLGPLREPVKSGLSRADAIILIDDTPNVINSEIVELNKETRIPIVSGFINEKNNFTNNNSKRVLAFSGIAFPEKFYNSLKKLGYKIIKTKEYPDHYPYTSKDVSLLKKISEKYKLKLITTEKDIVKIPKRFQSIRI